MRILQINTNDSRGGAARIAYSLKKELEKKGHQSPILVGRKYSDDKDIKLLNDILSFSGKVRRKLAYWLSNDIDIFTSDQLLNTREFKEADIVHCHNLHSNYFNLNTLQKISKIKPVIWTFHDLWPITSHCAHPFDGEIQNNGFFACPSLDIYPPLAWHNERYLENQKARIYKNSNFHIAVVSDWVKSKVSQSLLKDKSITVVHNGIDTNVFKNYDKNQARRELNIPLDKKIILSAIKGGQSNPWKGADYVSEITKSFRDNEDIIFIYLGNTSSIQEKNIINIPYTKDQTEMAKYYSAADILLYPSIADTFSLVSAEAMACGLPVLTFKTGGIPEVVEHKRTGYIAEYKNIKDLKYGFEYLINLGIEDKRNIDLASIERVRSKFTITKMTEEYLNIYKSLLK